MTDTNAAAIAKRDALSLVLREFLLRCGSEEARDVLATRLAREGLSAENLREICETQEARGKPPAETAGLIGLVLKTEEDWRAFVRDLVFARAARERRERNRAHSAAAATSPPYPNMPDGLRAPAEGPCAHGTPASESCTQCAGGSQP